MSAPSRPTRNRLGRSALAVLLGTLLLLPVQLVSPASAAPLPDLKIKAIKTGSKTVQQGAMLKVTDTTLNAGRAKARRTKTRYYLSRNKSYGKSDRLLGARKVKALRPGAKDAGSIRLRVPAATPARSWYVVACADATRKVRESREGNNCRATKSKITVTAPTTETPTFPLDPDPLTVGETTLEGGAAVSRTFDPLDPETLDPLVATAADGTTYTLEIPADALLSAEKITMTPVSAVAGLPLSKGLRAAVQLEPEGLMLQQPASLVITRPPGSGGGLGDLAEQTAFVFHGGGDDFHLYPMDQPRTSDDADTVRMSLAHFSTPGIGLATGADRSNVAAHPPARNAAQIAAANAEIARQGRVSAESGNPPDPGAVPQIISNLEAYYDGVVRGQLTAAETNAVLAAGATAEALAWARQMALLGVEDGARQQEMMVKLEKIWANAVEHYWRRCTTNHDLTAVGMLVGIARQTALLGWTSLSEKAFDYATRCSQYEVEFDSTMDYTRDYQISQSGHVSNTGHLRLQSTTTVPALTPGVSPLTYAEASLWQRVSGDGGWVEDNLITTQPGSMTADILERANPIDPGPDGPPPAPPVPYLRLLPGVGVDGVADPPQERIRKTSSNSGTEPTEADITFWMDQMLTFSEFYPLRIELDLVQVAGSEVLLDTTRDNSFGSVSSMIGRLTEFTTLKVNHTPEP